MADPRVRAWDQLIRDPCAANLAHPPYSGMDSGYLIRTVDLIQLFALGAGMTVGATVPVDVAVSYSPICTTSGTTNPAYLQMGVGPGVGGVQLIQSSGGSTSYGSAVVTNFINAANTPAKRYRPVAACLKWIPTGAYASRSGIVGVGYSPGSIAVVGEGSLPSQWLQLCQKTCANGADSHEVRFIPTSVDENFTNNTSTPLGGGTVFFAGLRLDATASSAVLATVNGTLEVTTVWEWEPAYNNGIVAAPRAPLPYTTQQILATIGDLGSYLFEGVRNGAADGMYRAGAGMVRGATRAAFGMLTKGVQHTGTRGPPLIMA